MVKEKAAGKVQAAKDKTAGKDSAVKTPGAHTSAAAVRQGGVRQGGGFAPVAEPAKDAVKQTPPQKAAPARTGDRGIPKARVGTVVSNKMQKTVVVQITRQVQHHAYGKFIRKSSRFFAHDEANTCQIGDTVRIVETRPMSRLKRWKVKEIVTRAD